MPDVAEIAGRLSEAERRALLRHKKEQPQEWRGRHEPTNYPVWSGVGHVLREFGLIDFVSDISSMTRLTPLGLAVRAYLENSREQ